jgi:hypothetical protein
MDVAALSLKIDSNPVVQAASDLDRFATSAAKAGAAAGLQNGSIAKLVATVQSMDGKLTAILGAVNRATAAMAAMAKGAQGAAAANDNVARSIGVADSHVIAYTQHLAGLAAAQNGSSAATAAADAHVVAYTQNLARLSTTQQQANAHVLAWQKAVQAQGSVQGDANAHVLAYRDSLKQVSEGAVNASKAIKFTAQDTLNASRQLADIGVTAASGMSPFLIAIQQGPQLLDILQNKAAVTGQSLGTVFKAAASAIWASLVPLLPIILPIIAALALATAGIAALTRQASDDSGLKKYTTAMGYSKEEVKKLNAVTVTWGDTTKAVFQVGLSSAAEALGINTKTMGKTWDTFLDKLASGTRATLAGVYAAIAGTRAYLGEIEKGGVLGIGKMLIGQGDPDLLKKTYGKAYADGQKGLDAIVTQARKNAVGRQAEMAKGFYDAPKPKKGPKQYTYADLLKDAQKTQDGLTKAGAQIGVYGESLARVTYEQDLFNKASEHSLKLTPQQTAHIKELAASMGALSERNRHSKFMEDFNQQSGQQLRTLEQANGAIGLTGAALAEYASYQDAVNKAIADHITLTDADKEAMRNNAGRVGAATYGNIKDQAADDLSRSHNEQMRQLGVERTALGLTGAALISYNYQQDLINKSVAAGVQIADVDIAKIRQKGDAYAAQRYEIDQQTKALDSSREVTRGFFADWVNGAREGGNIFKTFADAVLNSLNRIIDKLLDRTLDSFLDSMFKSGSGGILGGLFGGDGAPKYASPFAGSASVSSLTPNALGGVYGSPQRFANGGAFTNSVVSAPTLFRFANGGALGEMGEAGPEAIMPLKRGPNGALGVQMHGGGRPAIRMGDYNPNFSFEGAVGLDGIASMVRQGGEATYNQMKRDLQTLLQQLDTDGAFAS